MNTFITNRLSSIQYNDARELISQCKEHDGTRGVSFLEPELNADREFPCFYLMYDGVKLVSLLSVFVADDNQCEIYGCTSVEHREKGYFRRLLNDALKNIKKWNIENILLVNEPESKAGAAVLEKLSATLVSSEFLMSYDMSVTPMPLNKLDLRVQKDENTKLFAAYLADEQVGSCNVEFTRSHGVIYDFQIFPEYRGNGYGTELLLLILKHLIENDIEKIFLHVNGANTAAHAMYSHHGFVSEEQLDYWMLTQ